MAATGATGSRCATTACHGTVAIIAIVTIALRIAPFTIAIVTGIACRASSGCRLHIGLVWRCIRHRSSVQPVICQAAQTCGLTADIAVFLVVQECVVEYLVQMGLATFGPVVVRAPANKHAHLRTITLNVSACLIVQSFTSRRTVPKSMGWSTILLVQRQREHQHTLQV